ncbi:Sulfotransferase family protein [Hyella patelloides LEGE 07179]|uniref:Sulfotransferase family protein n=1 Tax=Hyella patelloides LEGE 07179 TaxID=945734 RepID=A0A563W208_9CYAN|nr:sulfotransferase [Hyella patelloides]VEP17697.1 Sulfotransferase family protein [Hyella patelloides LEGE 07179]VEP17706.1 Sulfotransferase family protein [Hyella patelloides LEGE 07179]
MASLFHPLCGSNPNTLLKLLTTNGALSTKRFSQIGFALTIALTLWPFSTLERVLMELTRGRRSPIQAPIFIVGYWRSGTTHLHNVLSQSPEFGYISPLATGLPWNILGIVRLFEPLLEKALPEDRHVDKVAVKPNSPQEDSIPLASMGAASYYHGLYFPKGFQRHFQRGVFFDEDNPQVIEKWQNYHIHLLEKVSIHQKGKQLLIKNPVYTGHIGKLKKIWPKAKFIHIYRNPYIVFHSTHHFFSRLLPEFALQNYDNLPINDLILESYPRMMKALQSDSADLPANSFVEIRFEDFEINPLKTIEQIYQTLELPGFEQNSDRFETYLSDIQGYQKNSYSFQPKIIELIESHWQPFIEQWGYKVP